MKFIVLVTSILSFLTCLSISVYVSTTKKHSSLAVISFDFQRHDVPFTGSALSSRGIQQATGSISQTIVNRVAFYSIDILIGTKEPQTVKLLLDTGSSDTWVNTPSTDYCQRVQNNCIEYGTFEPSNSQSFLPGEKGGLRVVYLDNTFATGNYGTDTITVGDRALTNFQFGLATTANIGHGTLGLGSIRKEAEVLQNMDNGYPNFPQALVDQKFIKTKAYSLWFNDLKADTGSIVFGGVDTAKFIGRLATFSSRRSTGSALRLEQVSLGNTVSSSFDVSIDSGSQNTMLPSDYVRAIWNAVNVVQGKLGEPFVDCSLANSPTFMNFNFGLINIRVPMSQLVYQDPEGKPPTPPSPNVSYCSFGITANPKPDQLPVLGDTFLRSAYVVHDLSRHEISIAQAKFTSQSNIVELDEEGVGKLYGSGIGGGQRPISANDDQSTMYGSIRKTGDRSRNGISYNTNDDHKNDDGSGYIPDNYFTTQITHFVDSGNPFRPTRFVDSGNPFKPSKFGDSTNPFKTRSPKSTYQQSTPGSQGFNTRSHEPTYQKTAPGGQDNIWSTLLASIRDKFSVLKSVLPLR